jgi:hypothetical protein
MSKRKVKTTTALFAGSLAKAVEECGGVLIYTKLKLNFGPNGGCASPTHVAGTNGGTLPCGSLLKMFGKTAPYYCGYCERDFKGHRHE